MIFFICSQLKINHIFAECKRKIHEILSCIDKFLKCIFQAIRLFQHDICDLISCVIRRCKKFHLIRYIQPIQNIIFYSINSRFTFHNIHISWYKQFGLFQIDQCIIKSSKLLIDYTKNMIHLCCSIFT